MTETVAPVATPAPRPPSRKAETVSASALALHLDCNRMYIGKLEAEGVIQRQGDGFPLDRSRVANWLCHRFPKTMYWIVLIVEGLMSGRRRR